MQYAIIYPISSFKQVLEHYRAQNAEFTVRGLKDGKKVKIVDAIEFEVNVENANNIVPFGCENEPVDVPETKVKTVKVITQPTIERSGRVTKSSLLRDQIKELKAANEYTFDQAVEWAVANLGFNRQLAKVYVKSAEERV